MVTKRVAGSVVRGGIEALLFLVATSTFGACSQKGSGSAGPAGSGSATATLCSAGTHVDASGLCVPDAVASASASAAPKPAGERCPATTDVETVFNLDWAKEFTLSDTAAAKARGTAGAGAEAHAFALRVESDLRAVCSRLAQDLGSHGPRDSAVSACNEATEAVSGARAKVGPAARVTVTVAPPTYTTSLDAFDTCAPRCDASVGDAKGSCEGAQPVGKCQGTCDGACDLTPGAACPGTCTGRCTANFHGTCKGGCKGTCNGKVLAQPGACTGTCDGSCDGQGKGECKNPCDGRCDEKAAACPGVCLGKCSVAVQEPLCPGHIKSSAAAECKTFCELRAGRTGQRSNADPANVQVSVDNAKDQTAAASYKTALERHLPELVRVVRGLKPRIDAAIAAGNAVTGGLKTVAQGSDERTSKTLMPCLSGFAQVASEASAGLKANAAAGTAVIAKATK